MFTFEHSIFINRPQEEIFDFVSDPANDPQWRPAVELSEWSSECPPGVGSTLHNVTKFMGRKLETTSEIMIWDPPNQIGINVVDAPVPYEFTFSLEARKDGTQFTGNFQGELGGLFSLAEGLVARQAEKEIVSNLDALKGVMEAGR